jgi:hypothetical protein
MKKFLLLSSVFSLITFVTYAQINKGSVLLGGGFSISKNKVEDANPKKDYTYISISPVAGIAVKQNTVVGLQFNYANSKDNAFYYQSYTVKNYGAEVFLRKYVTLGKGFYLFGQTGLGYSNYSSIYAHPTYEEGEKKWSVGIDLYPGVSYALNNKFHLELGLAQLVNLEYYKSKYSSQNPTEKRSGVNLNANASSFSTFTVGFRVFLSK